MCSYQDIRHASANLMCTASEQIVVRLTLMDCIYFMLYTWRKHTDDGERRIDFPCCLFSVTVEEVCGDIT